jgi:hypothetical protein
MKGIALLALAVTLDASFLYSIAHVPSREEANAQLAATARRATATPDDEPRIVSCEVPIVVHFARY